MRNRWWGVDSIKIDGIMHEPPGRFGVGWWKDGSVGKKKKEFLSQFIIRRSGWFILHRPPPHLCSPLSPEAQKLPYYASYGPARLAIHTLCTSHYLDLVITFIICINVITMSLEHYSQPQVSGWGIRTRLGDQPAAPAAVKTLNISD